SSLSPNRDAVWPVGDSSAVAGVSASHTCGGSSFQTSSQVAVSLAPCLIRVFGPQEFLLETLPGTAKTSRFGSRAHREVMRVPRYSAAARRKCSWEIRRSALRPRGIICSVRRVLFGLDDVRSRGRIRLRF